MNIFYAYNNLSLQPLNFEGYLKRVPGTARLKICRFHRRQDAYASLVGFLLLADGLDSLGFDGHNLVREMEYDGRNKPRLSNGLPDFNISHAGDLVVCAISADTQLGIDIEERKPIDTSDFDSCWCPEEMEWLRHQDDTTSAFFYLWTRKEAVLKAFGKGLSIDLKAINVLHDRVVTGENGTWTLQPLHIHTSYSAHIAFNREDMHPPRITKLTY